MKYYLFIVFFLLVRSSLCQSQKALLDNIASKYFTVVPEGKSLKEITEALETNISLKIDTTIPKTDTSLFYMRGYSDSFNPFDIPVSKIEILLMQGVMKARGYITTNDTLLVLQIIAVTDSSEEIKKILKSEVARINKEIGYPDDHLTYKKSKRKGRIAFESYVYNRLPRPYVFLTYGWGAYYYNTKIKCLSLSIHFKN